MTKCMSISDYLALAALLISIIAVPGAAWLSHVSAVRVFRYQNIETKSAQLFEAKKRFDQDLILYGQLVQTIGVSHLGADFNKKPLPDPEAFFTTIFQTGIHGLIITDVMRLRDLGFDILLETRDPSIQEALKLFLLNQQTLSEAKRAELVGRYFLENGVQARLAAISYEDIRSFVTAR